jgi:hypothetical protein
MDVGSEGRRVRGSEDRRVQRSDGQRVGRSEDQRVRDFEGQSVIASLTWTGSHSAENPLISPKSARWPRGARCEVLCEDPGPDSLHSDTPVLDDLVGQRSGEANDRALGRGVVEELMPISQHATRAQGGFRHLRLDDRRTGSAKALACWGYVRGGMEKREASGDKRGGAETYDGCAER